MIAVALLLMLMAAVSGVRTVAVCALLPASLLINMCMLLLKSLPSSSQKCCTIQGVQ